MKSIVSVSFFALVVISMTTTLVSAFTSLVQQQTSCLSQMNSYTTTPTKRTTEGSKSRLFLSDPKKEDDEEAGGLDLDLDEMFTMFDAAAKDESFDKAIKKVKKEG